MLKRLKLLALGAARACGAQALVLDSRWRRRRLLILCYHGVSLDDEHRWDPALYMSREAFRRRLERLRADQCAVLPFDEALRRVYAGDLPPRAIALTFDDGFYDFCGAAWPVLREFAFPATVYLTTYYALNNLPVFDPACRYLLWKGGGRTLDWPEILPEAVTLDPTGQAAADRMIKQYCLANHLDAAGKHRVLEEMAGRLGVDFAAICSRRILHLMTAEESASLAQAGVDLQLHTHRHRVSRRRETFWREIDENRGHVERMSGRAARHFCYPGGVHLPELPEWLAERGVASAVTCRPGLVSGNTDRFALPRLVDTGNLSEDEFAAWISGVAALLPKRRHVPSDGQILDE